MELVDPLVGRDALLCHAEPVAASTVEVGLDRTPGRSPRGVGLNRPVEEGIVGGGRDEERRASSGTVRRGRPVDGARERRPDVAVVVRGEIEDQMRARREADGADAVGVDVPLRRSARTCPSAAMPSASGIAANSSIRRRMVARPDGPAAAVSIDRSSPSGVSITRYLSTKAAMPRRRANGRRRTPRGRWRAWRTRRRGRRRRRHRSGRGIREHGGQRRLHDVEEEVVIRGAAGNVGALFPGPAL